ncbi:unnamed protein product [Ectocarpus sp. 6 AP-2014]
MDAEGYDFLRQLHGLPRRHTPNLRASPLTEAAARRRLSLFATLAGNDFADFKNIGPVRAAKVAFELIEPDPRGTAAVVPFEALVGNLARIVVQDSKEEETPAALEEAEEKLRRSHNMFHNAVVWDPLKNTLRHFSCAASSLAITKDTGTLEFSSVASGIASGEVSPTTGQVWAPPLLETRIAQEFRRATRRAGSQTPPPPPPPGPTPTPDQSTGRNKRSRKAVTHDTNNYHKHGFSRLPGAEEDFNKWTVAQLREFLSVFRCLDHAGHSAYLKGPLAELAGQVVAMIKKCGLLNSNQAFRHPVPDLSSFQDKERMAMPELPGPRSRIRGFEHLQQHLPEMSKSVILQFLRQVNPISGEGSRVWYRGMQKVMDMGNLNRLWGVPAKNGLMYLGMSLQDHTTTAPTPTPSCIPHALVASLVLFWRNPLVHFYGKTPTLLCHAPDKCIPTSPL